MRMLPPTLGVLIVGVLISLFLPAALEPRVEAPPPPESPARTSSWSWTAPLQNVPEPSTGPSFEEVGKVGSELSGAVLQDRDGFLWVGSYGGGLFRFDGKHLARFQAPQGALRNANVTALFEDRDGVLWIATLGGLDRYDKESGSITPAVVANGEAIGGLWSIHAREGELWLGTNGEGLIRYRPESGELRRYRSVDGCGLVNDNIYRIASSKDGALWLGSFGGGVMRFGVESESVSQVIDTTDGLSNGMIWSLLEATDGTLWIGTQDGLGRYDPVAKSLCLHPHELGDPATVGGRVITGIREDVRGRLWLTSFDGPCSLTLFEPRDGTAYRFDEASGMASRGARCAFEDDAGIFWVVTMTGLLKFDEGALGIHLMPFANGLLPILEDRDALLWFGTMNGLRAFDRGRGRFRQISDPLLSTSLISALAEDEKGRFWVATFGGDLHLYDRADGVITRSFRHDPRDPETLPASNCIRKILVDRRNADRLWLATQGGGLARFDCASGRVLRYRNDPKRPTSLSNDVLSFGALLQDPDGSLWVGSDDGLNHFDPKSGCFRRISSPDLRSSVIQAIHRSARGTLWVATARGLHRMEDDRAARWKAFTTADGLPEDMVLGILEDRDFLWLSTATGLARFDPSGREAVRVFGRDEGLRAAGFLLTSYCKTADGELWFGGPDGASHFRPRDLEASAYRPPLALTALRRDGVDIALGKDPCRARELLLSWPDNRFEFEVAALSFSQPGFNRYRYRLEGFDKDWFETPRGFGRYGSLPGGEYLLRVQAASASGTWNEAGVALKLRVMPPFWRSRWGISAMLLVITFLVAAGTHYTCALAREVRERRKAESDRDQAEARLRETTRVEALGRLAAGVSHDFNNLLTVVLGEISLLRMRLPDELAKEFEADCTAIESAALRGADLTAQLLAYSSRREATTRVIDLNSVVSAARRLFSRVVGEDVGIEYEIDRRKLAVRVDPTKISQVLMNLVINARQAMPDGGRLVIRTGCERSEVDSDSMSQVFLEVQDSGSGIPADVIERMFDPFFTTKRRGEGTGLGLAIVKEVVEQHGGKVLVESEVGVGSTFRVLLPLVDGEVAPEESAPKLRDTARRGGRLLLVEDDALVRTVVRSVLVRAGYEVLAAGSATEALEIWDRDGRGIRVVVSDIVLPDLDGDVLVDQLRSENPDLPVLFLSGYAPEQTRINPRGAGPWRIVAKPVRPLTLVETLDEVLLVAQAAGPNFDGHAEGAV